MCVVSMRMYCNVWGCLLVEIPFCVALAADVAEPTQEKLGGWSDTAGLQRTLQPQRKNSWQHARPCQKLPQGGRNQQG